ncbi:guanine nucleotide exchange factor DBS isoform X1 [Lates japonicus]|uniref:Guanine nucleotide exchange factor DBS isoform X1 n=1 Tax=Lates japonicus TaxID=270547 RepID=A0AAD3N004_LATJO|nr:guanine nucleotide exchange factor DBS isoform X1 [Lates japonicus]
MRRAILFSLPAEMMREEEENGQRDGMGGRTGKRGERSRERSACISLGEMESYYRYTKCCQQLHSEF